MNQTRLERIAEEAVERCDSINNMYSDQRAATKQVILDALATYAAEQLTATAPATERDGGGLEWVRIDVAQTWPIGTAMVVQPAMFYDGKVKNLAVFVDGLTQEIIDRVTKEEAICRENRGGFGYWFHRLENMVATKDFIPQITTPTT